ncbi:hypothetical protein [Alkalicoccus chagannorensis]|uniref:hypothetical protein n=1 Tax=Alkalicoccus chagannorensis TaxID=427072 RepID=UPI0004074EEE|nr:hypothetical protein [Alkalicoccus chagannorensis]
MGMADALHVPPASSAAAMHIPVCMKEWAQLGVDYLFARTAALLILTLFPDLQEMVVAAVTIIIFFVLLPAAGSSPGMLVIQLPIFCGRQNRVLRGTWITIGWAGMVTVSGFVPSVWYILLVLAVILLSTVEAGQTKLLWFTRWSGCQQAAPPPVKTEENPG